MFQLQQLPETAALAYVTIRQSVYFFCKTELRIILQEVRKPCISSTVIGYCCRKEQGIEKKMTREMIAFKSITRSIFPSQPVRFVVKCKDVTWLTTQRKQTAMEASFKIISENSK